MDKLKRSLKHLIAPAIVLLLVAIMGVFSPVVSVAAALRMNPLAVESQNNYTIENLPARTVELGSTAAEIIVPTIDNNGKVVLCHAGKEIDADTLGSKYKYTEVGQYEWRFYTDNTKKVLFDTYTVTVTDTTYSMTMPDNVVTVAPKDLGTLTLPLPSTYRIGGETMEVAKIENQTVAGFDGKYAVVTFKDHADSYVLRATVALENNDMKDQITALNHNGLVVNLGDEANTGLLKVTYQLYSTNQKLLVALPLADIEIKDVKKNQVTFANIPTAPSVKSLAYYSSVSLTAPTADSAKVGATSFNVEAQTAIYKVQCYLYADEPKDWTANDAKIHNLTVEKTADGNWVVKENGTVTDKYLDIDGLTVKIKAIGWYRFQFQTSTLFGYQLAEDFDADEVNVELDDNHAYVRYWSDSIRIYRDTIEPNFAWVGDYTIDYDSEGKVVANATTKDFDERFSELHDYDIYLPMTERPDATATQKITVNYDDGLVLPALFPHDNATPFEKMKVTTFNIEQIQDENGQAVTSSDNRVWSSDKADSSNFVYDMSKHVQIKFVADKGNRTQGNNTIELYRRSGLYRVRIVVEEVPPTFEDGQGYSSGYANTKTKYLYFYVDGSYQWGTDTENSPVIDANNVFQVSDVYLWEGKTFDFRVPTYTDTHTPADNIQTDYYLVNANTNEVLSQLEVKADVSRVTVDLDNLYQYNNPSEKLVIDDVYLDGNANFYIYAVARNFNGLQNNLKVETKIVDIDNILKEEYFDTDLFKTQDVDQIAQYGYAWKRAAFTIHKTQATSAAATIIVTPKADNDYTAGKTIVFDSITAKWNGTAAVDGQMTAAVYLVKDGTRVPVNLVNNQKASSAEIVSAVSFNLNSYTAEGWCFTPGVGGQYILVVTAKDHASSQIQTHVETIKVESSGEWNVTPLSVAPAATTNYTVDATITLGESLVLPNWVVSKDDHNGEKYFAKNRNLYAYDADGKVGTTVAGNYTITVLGVNDPNCVIGNKFVPNKNGTYVFQYAFTKDSGNELLKTVDYVVQVNNESNSTANIRMGEDYDAKRLLENADDGTGETDPTKTQTVGNDQNGKFTYLLGSNETGTENKPAYAITLPQFTMSNYGAATDFVVDSASLFDYLEPIYKDGQITGYMYPAIAIPMPNVVTDTTSSDEVEITVQKSGSSNYLVSSKKLNAGGSSNKASVIDSIDGYYVFRPDGEFTKDCKDKYNANNYADAAVSPSRIAGVYTVSYKTSNSSVNFNVTFGNLKNGNLAWEEGFLTYDNNDGKGAQEITDNGDTTANVVIEKVDGHRYVTIDLSKLYFEGNKDMNDMIDLGPDPDNGNDGYNPDQLDREYYWKNVTVTVSYEGGSFIDYSDWSDAEDETEAIKIYGAQDDGYKYLYKFDLSKGSGTYKVNVSMPNRYTGNVVTKSIEFTIDVDATNKNHNLNNVWGIILIVLSVGLLAGVIFYFVKTARATRFVDVPRAAKGKDKTPKAVEAPKEDVK